MAKPSRRDAKGKEIYSTSYEPSKVRLRVRVLLLFALAGADSRPGGSVKTICTYHVHCTRRRAALRVNAAALGSN